MGLPDILLDHTFFTSWITLALTCAVLLFAELVYVMFGFGAGLIAVGLMASLSPDLQQVVVLLMLVNLPVELQVVWSSRRRITWRGVCWIGLGVAVGVPLGALVLKNSAPTLVLMILGLFLIMAGGAFLLTPERQSPAWPRPAVLGVGLLAGVLAGLFGTGGPPLIFYFRLRSVDKAVFRGNLMALFLLMSLVRIPVYGAAGLITSERLWSAVVVLPVVILGAVIGHRFHLSIKEATFQRLVAIGLVLIGGALLWN